jgi:hypothetical protein
LATKITKATTMVQKKSATKMRKMTMKSIILVITMVMKKSAMKEAMIRMMTTRSDRRKKYLSDTLNMPRRLLVEKLKIIVAASFNKRVVADIQLYMRY